MTYQSIPLEGGNFAMPRGERTTGNQIFHHIINLLRYFFGANQPYNHRCARSVYEISTGKNEDRPIKSLDSAKFVGSDEKIIRTDLSGRGVSGRLDDANGVDTEFWKDLVASARGQEEELRNMPASNRTTITLTKTEVDALEKLREHFSTQSVSETIRRSISQSSLLKRYSDEDGDLVVERAGKRYVIPSRN